MHMYFQMSFLLKLLLLARWRNYKADLPVVCTDEWGGKGAKVAGSLCDSEGCNDPGLEGQWPIWGQPGVPSSVLFFPHTSLERITVCLLPWQGARAASLMLVAGPWQSLEVVKGRGTCSTPCFPAAIKDKWIIISKERCSCGRYRIWRVLQKGLITRHSTPKSSL